MGTKVWSAACAAIFSLHYRTGFGLSAYEPGVVCPGPQGPIVGNPDPRLHEFDLVSNGRSNIGV
jgi:hypothetical protein